MFTYKQENYLILNHACEDILIQLTPIKKKSPAAVPILLLS